MSTTQANKIEIIKAATSKINEVDFENLSFGSVFTDHLFECDFRNGEWQNPVIKPYAPFLLDPSAKVFHYGQAIFEGMKAYKDDNNDLWLFRPVFHYVYGEVWKKTDALLWYHWYNLKLHRFLHFVNNTLHIV